MNLTKTQRRLSNRTYGNVCFLRLHGFFSKNVFLEDQTTTSFIWIMKIANMYNVPSTHFFKKKAQIIWLHLMLGSCRSIFERSHF